MKPEQINQVRHFPPKLVLSREENFKRKIPSKRKVLSLISLNHTIIYHMSLVLIKLGLIQVRKVSSQISLCSLYMPIRDDAFRLNSVFAKERRPLNKNFHKNGNCRTGLAYVDCTGLSGTTPDAYALSSVFPGRGSNASALSLPPMVSVSLSKRNTTETFFWSGGIRLWAQELRVPCRGKTNCIFRFLYWSFVNILICRSQMYCENISIF